MRTWFFYHSSAQMYFCNVEFQVVVAVGGIRTLGTHLVFYSQMDPFDVHIHILLAAECLVTLGARNLGLRLNIGLATSSPQQMTFELFENLATELAGFQALVCVSRLEVFPHLRLNFGGIVTLGALLHFTVRMEPVEVNSKRVLC